MPDAGQDFADQPGTDPLRRAADRERPTFSAALHERMMDAILEAADAAASNRSVVRLPVSSVYRGWRVAASLAVTLLLAACLLWPRMAPRPEPSRPPEVPSSASLPVTTATADMPTAPEEAVATSPKWEAGVDEFQFMEALDEWDLSSVPADHVVLPLAADALAAALIDTEWDDLRHDVQHVLSLVADPLAYQPPGRHE